MLKKCTLQGKIGWGAARKFSSGAYSSNKGAKLWLEGNYTFSYKTVVYRKVVLLSP